MGVFMSIVLFPARPLRSRNGFDYYAGAVTHIIILVSIVAVAILAQEFTNSPRFVCSGRCGAGMGLRVYA